MKTKVGRLPGREESYVKIPKAQKLRMGQELEKKAQIQLAQDLRVYHVVLRPYCVILYCFIVYYSSFYIVSYCLVLYYFT